MMRWIDKILLIRPWHDYPEPKATPNPPPWDVPLDQTTPQMRYVGDIYSV